MNERVIFDAALEIDDPDARRAFVEKSCAGDEPLRAAVEALLTSHEAAGSFLNMPVADLMRGEPMKSDSTKEGEPQGSSGSNSPGRSSDPADKTHVYESGIHKVDDADDESAPNLSFLEPSSKPGSIGVLGHYEVLKVLGQGGFGIVLKAFDEKLHRHVAIKVMNAQMAATSPPRKRFLREARAAAAIRHENIVQVYSVEEQPLPYLVMEFIDGPTLQQKQAGHGPLEVPEWLDIGRQIAAGLASAHATGLIHRDIKPGNVLIEEVDGRGWRVEGQRKVDGRGLKVEGQTDPSFEPQPLSRPQPSTFNPQLLVKITDFGLARAADDASLSRSGTISGTPMYMAPEQALGQTLDHRADLFSLGSVLYELATGRPPFRAANTIAVLRRVVDDTPRPMQEIIPELPDWLVVIVNKLLAKNPDERFQSAKEVADLLGRCQLELQLSGQVTCVNVDESLRDSKSESRSDSPTYAKTLDYKSPRLRDDSDDAPGKGDLRSSDSARSGGSNSTKPSQAKRSVLKVALIAMAFAVLGVFPLARLIKPAIDAWTSPPIPKLAETDVPGGLRFDGKDDFVKVGPFDLSSPQYTLEAFVTSASDGDNGVIALLKNDGKESELMYLYDGYPAKVRKSGAGIIGQRPYQTVNAPLMSGTREHRALVMDGQVMHYFVNGIWQGKRYCTARQGRMWEMRELIIGCKANETEFFRGQIDQLRLSKIARYSSNFAPVTSVTSDDSTLALYNFDEGIGDVLKDASGHGHDGKIIGAAWVKPKSPSSFSNPQLPTPDPASWHGWPADAPVPAIAPFNAEQAKQHQEAWAKYLGVPVEYTNTLGMKFHLIPPAEFTMGSTKEKIAEALKSAEGDPLWQECIQSEGPRHQVILTQPTYLGVYEVTQGQYEHVIGTNPSRFGPMGTSKEAITGMDTTSFPVERVSWKDATEFCVKLGEVGMRVDGTAYRLPSDAEWEFACRAGTTTEYWFGENVQDRLQAAWFYTNSSDRTHAVGELKDNPFGLFDIHGNVWEWVQDAWDPTFYKQFQRQPAIDPLKPSVADSPHVTRGGNWSSSISSCRTASRCPETAAYSGTLIGFRVVLTVDAVRKALKLTGPAIPNEPKATASKFPPLAPGWFERVSKLPPEEQVKEVAAELKRRNPEWDEKLEHQIQDGYVLDVRFDSTQVADIAPLAALTDLRVLFCTASKPSDRLTELSPLAGLKQLHAVYFTNCTSLSDLSALRDLRITDCSLQNTSVTDLSPLSGKPILYLELSQNRLLTDLSPLKGAPLSSAFSCQRTGIRDLSPLRDSQVKQVVLHDNQFDPDIVCGWPLKSIHFNGTMLSVPRAKLLRLKEIKTLETIDGKPVAEFWKEFGQ